MNPRLSDIEYRMRRYLVFRLLATVLGSLLVTVYLSCLAPETRGAAATYLYGILTAYLFVGLILRVTFPRWRAKVETYHRQVLLDFIMQAALVWATGGMLSIFSPLLFVTLAASTGIAGARGAHALAIWMMTLLVAATLAYTLGFTPSTSEWAGRIFRGENGVFVIGFLIANLLGLYGISTLGRKLSRGLRNVEDLQTEILENMAEGLLAIDESGRVIRVNSEARRLLGIAGDEPSCRDRSLRELLGQSVSYGRKSWTWDVWEAFESARGRRIETEIAGGDDRRPIGLKVSTIRGDASRPEIRVGVISDLTLARKIDEAQKRIEKLEELQVMAMGIAHEIRNPLASIRGCVQEISRVVQGASTEARLAAIVMKESDRLDQIIEDFLAFTRSSSVELEPLDLVEVIEEAVELLRSRPDLGAREIVWEAPVKGVEVVGDRGRLLQVFLNLGINALQATSADDGLVSIELWECSVASGQREEEATPGVEIVVRDNGNGIEEDVLRNVFTPFYTTKNTGSGLGLSIVDRILREHGGLIDIDTGPGRGTAICVRLPVRARVPDSTARASAHVASFI